MCLNPIYIGNRSRRFTDGLSRTILAVPCGHCVECQKEMQDEWFVRAFWEYNDTKANNGTNWFTLFTYNDDNVPYFHDEASGFSCPCFDPSHAKKFRDMFRTYLKRDRKKGLIDYPDDVQIKFKFCCEFGGDKGRPHMHVVTHIPFEIKVLDHSYYHSLIDYMRGVWNPISRTYENGLFARCWRYGFVSWSKKHGCLIKSEKGIQYSMKYVTKEQHWIKVYGIDKYIDDLKRNIKLLGKKFPEYELRLKAIQRVLPRHFTSSNYGASGIDMFKKEDGSFDIDLLASDKVDLTSKRFGSKCPDPKHPSWTYHIPRYIKRKIMFDVDKFSLWIKNDIGLQVDAARFLRSKKFKEELFSTYMDESKFLEHVSFLFQYKDNEFNRMDALSDFDALQMIMSETKYMRKRTVSDLAMYDMVYRGIPLSHDSVNGVVVPYNTRSHHEGDNFIPTPFNIGCNHWYFDCFSLSPDDMLDYFKIHELPFYLDQQKLTREPDPKHHARCHDKHFYDDRNGFEIFDCFKDFDYALDIIKKYELAIGECKQSGYDIKEQRKKDILSICMPFSVSMETVISV